MYKGVFKHFYIYRLFFLKYRNTVPKYRYRMTHFGKVPKYRNPMTRFQVPNTDTAGTKKYRISALLLFISIVLARRQVLRKNYFLLCLKNSCSNCPQCILTCPKRRYHYLHEWVISGLRSRTLFGPVKLFRILDGSSFIRGIISGVVQDVQLVAQPGEGEGRKRVKFHPLFDPGAIFDPIKHSNLSLSTLNESE